MGGSSSGGWSPTPPSDRCGELDFTSQLNSPQGPVVGKLTPGEVLGLGLSPMPRQVVEVTKDGLIAGVLTGPEAPALIRCLTAGYLFKAVVVSIQGGDCTIHVNPA